MLTAEGCLPKAPEVSKKDWIPSNGFQNYFSKQMKKSIGSDGFQNYFSKQMKKSIFSDGFQNYFSKQMKKDIGSDGFQNYFSKQMKKSIGNQSKETLEEMLRNVFRICSGVNGNANTLNGCFYLYYLNLV